MEQIRLTLTLNVEGEINDLNALAENVADAISRQGMIVGLTSKNDTGYVSGFRISDADGKPEDEEIARFNSIDGKF